MKRRGSRSVFLAEQAQPMPARPMYAIIEKYTHCYIGSLFHTASFLHTVSFFHTASFFHNPFPK
jgi:hypothetical protein